MNRVQKFQIQLLPTEMLTLPRGASILNVKEEKDGVFVYALCQDELPFESELSSIETYILTICGTGALLSEPGVYIGSVTTAGVQMVWHVFSRKVAGV